MSAPAKIPLSGLPRGELEALAERLLAENDALKQAVAELKAEVATLNLIRHPDRTFHEKGVDVRLAVEMIRLAREDHYGAARSAAPPPRPCSPGRGSRPRS